MQEFAREQVDNWLFALLRFAITRDEKDREAAAAQARALDQGGSRFEVAAFDFFARSSRKFCEDLGHSETEAHADIARFLARIEPPRLRRAFEAALDHAHRQPKPKSSTWLWKGLERRGPSIPGAGQP